MQAVTPQGLHPATGLPAYDIAEFHAEALPEISHLHLGGGMSVLFQHQGQPDVRCREIVVPPAPTAVLVSRLGGRCVQACRLAGKPTALQVLPGLHTFFPQHMDSWWASDLDSLSGWFHLHFSPQAIAEASAVHEVRFDRELLQMDTSLSALVEQARLLTAAGQRPEPLVWDALTVLVLNRIAQLLRDRRDQSAPVETLAGWQVRRVTEYLDARYHQPVRLAELADLVGLSAFHFARAFRATLGVPPYRYQTLLRIERAKVLLRESPLSMLQVAQAVGYEAASSFTRAFRAATGLSPRQYRQSLGRR